MHKFKTMTLKRRLLTTFIPAITGALVLMGWVLWYELSQTLENHGDSLQRNHLATTQSDLKRAHATLDLFTSRQLDRISFTLDTLARSNLVQDFIFKSQSAPLNLQLQKAQQDGAVDFLTVIDLHGNVLASFPQEAREITLGTRYRSSPLGALIQTAMTGDDGQGARAVRGIVQLEQGFIDDLALNVVAGRAAKRESGELAFVSATIVENDFGETLGTLIAGKLISRWDRALTGLYHLTSSQVAIYSGPTPLIGVGFPDAIPPLSRAATSTATPFEVAIQSGGEGFTLSCTPLTDIGGSTVGAGCMGVADSVHQEAVIEMNEMLFAMQHNVQKWLLIIGGLTVLGVSVLSVLAAHKIATPISAISNAMLRLANDETDVDIPAPPEIEEIHALTTSMKAFKANAQEQKITLEALRIAKNEAEQANRAKSIFLSSMSHELRTPMNAILGFSQLLKVEPDICKSEKHSASMDHILSAGTHLLHLIDQVLELNQIETGKLSINIEDVALFSLVRECMDLITPIAEKRGITLMTEMPLPNGQLRADRTRLKQVLLNLLTNAIKYNSDKGAVTISCKIAQNDRLRIEVADTGIGIPADKHDEVFSPFARLGVESSNIEGTGIGLTISKQLIGLMDGKIDFTSTLDVGTVFWVELPFINEGASVAS